ncbi:MAG TPA: DUF4830 domain-containing protein [Bacillota bacterium]|nr:DUF4830 domain-containing protein [Bacillota bacterium]
MATVRLPDEFDSAYSAYNALQQSQGLDLTRFCGKEITRYTYTVTNVSEGETILATLLVYRDRLIGGDIYTAGSAGENGSVCTFASY